MNSKNSTIVVFGILATVIILSIFAYYNQKSKNQIIGDSINQELLIPYINELRSSNYELAYHLFTSKDYKKKYTLAKYKAAQDSNLVANGKIIALKPLSGIFVKETATGGITVFKGTVALEAEKGKKNIVVEITIENDSMKINRTYDSYLTMSNILPVIY